jgi:hypothetical protein
MHHALCNLTAFKLSKIVIKTQGRSICIFPTICERTSPIRVSRI